MDDNNSTSVFLQTLLYVVNQTSIPDDSSYNYYYMNIGQGTVNINEMPSAKCYGSYGCFELSPPWTSEHRPISLFPEDVLKIEPSYLYYSRRNPIQHIYIDLDDFDFVETTGIDPNIPLYVISHGFLEGGENTWAEVAPSNVQKKIKSNRNTMFFVPVMHQEVAKIIHKMKSKYSKDGNQMINKLLKNVKVMVQELLSREDCSIIAVDWHGGSGPPYAQAVANIRLVSVITAHLLAEFATHTGDKKLDHVHCIGHSLGAHLSGYIGFTLQRDFGLTVGRITGLDPAEPHFAKAAAPVRLDRSAAQYVDVIHTDASAFIRGGLGMTEKIGHVDYYPNGGTDQPGCQKSMAEYISAESGSFVKGMKKFLGCNHIRSHEIFIESINPKCSFLTISCNSYEDFKEGKCFECGKYGQHCITFGYHSRAHYNNLIEQKHITPQQSLVQYLMTGEEKPFCRSHYRITVDMSNSEESKRHGGEVGQLSFVMHSTRDGKGLNSGEVVLNEGGYHEPGAQYRAVVPANGIPYLKSVEVKWNYHSSLFNPLTWRLISNPRIFVTKVQVESMETQQSITVCSRNDQPLLFGMSQLYKSSDCP